jgi:ATP-dependent helicase HepA
LFDLTRTASIKEHDPDLNPFLTEQCIIASVDLMIDHEDLREQALKQVLTYLWSMKHIT